MTKQFFVVVPLASSDSKEKGFFFHRSRRFFTSQCYSYEQGVVS